MAFMLPALLIAAIALGSSPGVSIGLGFAELAWHLSRGAPATGPCHRAGLMKVTCP